jgi:hypothetical protein
MHKGINGLLSLVFNYFFFLSNRLSENGKPFEARITIPKLTIKAKYTSSGVLIIIPASGTGEFDAIFGKVWVFCFILETY